MDEANRLSDEMTVEEDEIRQESLYCEPEGLNNDEDDEELEGLPCVQGTAS